MDSTSKPISDYFYKIPKGTKSSLGTVLHGQKTRNHHPSTSKQSESDKFSSETAERDALSDEQIMQVLTECDRLVGNQKVRSDVNFDLGTPSRTHNKTANQIEEEGQSVKLQGKNGKETPKSEEDISKPPQNVGEHSRLMSCLDEVDRRMSSS